MKRKDAENNNCYTFFPERPTTIVLLCFISLFLLADIILLFSSEVPVVAKVSWTICVLFWLTYAIYRVPSIFHQIIMDYSGLKSTNTRTGESVYQPWSNFEVIYCIRQYKGPGIVLFAVSEFSAEEIKSMIKWSVVEKGKPILSVNGNIFFYDTANPKLEKKYLPYSLRTERKDVYVTITNKYKIKQ